MKNAVTSLFLVIFLSTVSYAQDGILVDQVKGSSGGWVQFDRIQLRQQVIRQLSNNRANTGWRVYDREQVRDEQTLNSLPRLNIYFRYEEVRSRSDRSMSIRIPTSGRSRFGPFSLPRNVSTSSHNTNRGLGGVIVVNVEIFSPQGEVLFTPEAISLSAEQYRSYQSSSTSTQYFRMSNSSRTNGDRVARLAIQTKVVQDASNQLMNSIRGWWQEYRLANRQLLPQQPGSVFRPTDSFGGPPTEYARPTGSEARWRPISLPPDLQDQAGRHIYVVIDGQSLKHRLIRGGIEIYYIRDVRPEELQFSR
ncbi:hypothetical protein KC644_03115 [Candidatus Berkelbacteria bacterium]|nr:hypothetical protein [Candidatus Berkelbacteria bacterium]